MTLKLSVLMPVYNERHLVGASLKRVLNLRSEYIEDLQVVVVDDHSTDGSWELLSELAAQDERIVLVRHEENRGKGAAIRTALSHASGDVCIIHDADLEYNPEDIPAVLAPFVREGADAVFGSRYLSAAYRRALMHKHTLMNGMLTFVSNWFTDLHLTDVETSYKAVRTTLMKSLPLRSDDFRIEVELAAKLAKRRATVFEVPIRYLPRSYEEGKKIRARDGLLALLAIVRYALVDDLYKKDEYGSHILVVLEQATRFNTWMGRTLRPFVGDRVLEVGAGIGTLTNQFIPRDFYVASDINPHYLEYLRSYSVGKPYLNTRKLDVEDANDFEDLKSRFDTAIMVNVLEHVDEESALRNLWSALEDGGRAVILVPQHVGLYGTLDVALEHRRRYTRASLEAALGRTGFRVERIFDFNRFSVPGWWLNGKVLRRTAFSRAQLKIVNTLVPVMSRLDRLLPWGGLSLIAVGVKEAEVGGRSLAPKG
jgi:glycosyltransferase involved in cell wall biosynthesis